MARRRITTTVTDLDEDSPRRRKRPNDLLRRIILVLLFGLIAWGINQSCLEQQRARPVYVPQR